MDDYAVVVNAGSSSLKFSVFRQPASASWHVEARGQVEGIGTSPHMTAKDGAGQQILEQALDDAVRDASSALTVVAD